MDFETLYNEHYAGIYRLAYRMLGEREEARDIVQEVFIKLHRQVGTNGALTYPRAWLYRVAANACTNILRQRRNRNETGGAALDEIRVESGIENNLEVKQTMQMVKTAIAQLSARDRLLVLLHLDGLSYREMATVTGIRETSVGKLLSRAVNRLAGLVKGGKSRCDA